MVRYFNTGRNIGGIILLYALDNNKNKIKITKETNHEKETKCETEY